jgi:tRNA-specific 2-thiouridylase
VKKDSKKAIVAMSGGIDSSAAALILMEKGYRVEGAIMAIYDPTLELDDTGYKACFGPGEEQDIADARQVAAHLGIPLHIIDLKNAYRKTILNFFIDEYRAGKTPNPCVRCNCRLKFLSLGRELVKKGIRYDYFATGHYARMEPDPDSGHCYLKRGRDPVKDQSYFLYQLPRELLPGLLFPLGEFTKKKIRELAGRHLPFLTAREESQDFIEGGYHQLFAGSTRSGPILTVDGKEIGTHPGIEYFTIGQRRGLGIAAPEPLYVIRKDPDRNALIVGPRQKLLSTSCSVSRLNWLIPDIPQKPFHCGVMIRYNSPSVSARIVPSSGNRARIEFDHPQSAVTPGQAAVFYQENTVLGGGTIV